MEKTINVEVLLEKPSKEDEKKRMQAYVSAMKKSAEKKNKEGE